jgi:zinc protease
MYKKISFLIILFIVVCGFGFQKPADNFLPFQMYQYQMSNGLNVVTVPFDSPGIAAFFIVVRVGSRNEIEDGVTGFAHFFEHMMFRGTEKYSKDKYEAVLKSIGASANANTSLDRTVYHMVGNVEKLDLMFEIETDRFQNLKYSEHDFKTEAGAVKGEYTKNNSNPFAQLYENMQNTAFEKHTYKHTTMGFYKDIVDMPNQYQYSLKFFDRYYRPEYCTILVVGDVTQDKVNKLAEKYFGNWKHGNYSADIPVEPPQTETKFTHLQNAYIKPYLQLAFKGPAYSDKEKDGIVLDIIEGIFFSNKSELSKKLVLNEKKCLNIRFGAYSTRDPNLISAAATVVNKEDMQYVKDEIMKTLEYIKTNPVDIKMIKEVVSNSKYSTLMRLDNPGSIANMLAQYIWLTGDPESINRYYAIYDTVTPDDLMNVAKKYFVTTGLTIGTISPDETAPVK